MKYRHRFGVAIPHPFKEDRALPPYHTIEFVIEGVVVSKKNRVIAVTRTKEAKEYIIQSAAGGSMVRLSDAIAAIKMVSGVVAPNPTYTKDLEWLIPLLVAQKQAWLEKLGPKGLVFPLEMDASMTLKLYFKTRRITDTVNKQQTIQDLLVLSGILKDDNYRRLNPIKSSSACYAGELTKNISSIALSFKL